MDRGVWWTIVHRVAKSQTRLSGSMHMHAKVTNVKLSLQLRGKQPKAFCVCCHPGMSTLCSPMDCSPPGSSVHGISQVRILEQVAMSFSRASSLHRDGTCVSYVSCIGRCVLYHQHHLRI